MKPGELVVRHYKIRNKDDGGVYITARKTFSNLTELIEHYKCMGNIFFILYKGFGFCY
jgi:hypothetical protein